MMTKASPEDAATYYELTRGDLRGDVVTSRVAEHRPDIVCADVRHFECDIDEAAHALLASVGESRTQTRRPERPLLVMLLPLKLQPHQHVEELRRATELGVSWIQREHDSEAAQRVLARLYDCRIDAAAVAP